MDKAAIVCKLHEVTDQYMLGPDGGLLFAPFTAIALAHADPLRPSERASR